MQLPWPHGKISLHTLQRGLGMPGFQGPMLVLMEVHKKVPIMCSMSMATLTSRLKMGRGHKEALRERAPLLRLAAAGVVGKQAHSIHLISIPCLTELLESLGIPPDLQAPFLQLSRSRQVATYQAATAAPAPAPAPAAAPAAAAAAPAPATAPPPRGTSSSSSCSFFTCSSSRSPSPPPTKPLLRGCVKTKLAAAPPSAATAQLQEQLQAQPTPQQVLSSMPGGDFPAAGPDWVAQWGRGPWLEKHRLPHKAPGLMEELEPFKRLALDPRPTTNRAGVSTCLVLSLLQPHLPWLPRCKLPPSSLHPPATHTGVDHSSPACLL